MRYNSIFSSVYLGSLGLTLLLGSSVARAEDSFTALMNKYKKTEEKPSAEAASAAPVKKHKKHKHHVAEVVAEDDEIEVEAPAGEGVVAKDAAGGESKEKLILKSDNHCLVVDFDSQSGEIISCTKALPLNYTVRDCASSKVIENGSAESVVACPDKKRIELRFRTSTDAFLATLRVQRLSKGRAGIDTHYQVEHFGLESGSIAALLPEATVRPVEGEKVEEAPLTFKATGFAWIEGERTKHFGFADSTAAQNNETFFSNLSFEVGKDKTTLVSILELGEIYFGDLASGGAQGTRAPIVELRNFYLNHQLSNSVTAKAGLITTGSDPRSFVFADHIASVQLAYKTDLSEGLLWYGNAAQNRPGAALARDEYLGLSGTLGFLSRVKGTVFGLVRSKANDVLAVDDGAGSTKLDSGNALYSWLGGTFDYDGFNPVAVQASLIGNWGKTKLASTTDSYSAYLADARVSYLWPSTQINLSLEGLATSGASGATDSSGVALAGKRKAFASPIGAAYLMTIATSDGVDDAPGTPKQSIIGNLGMSEGLRAVVLSGSFNVHKKTTALVRVGHLASAAKSSVTNSSVLGNEFDLEGVYQLSPSTTLQADFAQFYPGAYFVDHATAYLIAAKLKFSF